MSSEQQRPVLVVIGAGPGVSGSLARLAAGAGYDLGLVGIDEAVLSDLGTELAGLGAIVHHRAVDITDEDAASAAITALAREFGHVEALHFNPSAYRERTPLTLSVEDLLTDVRLGIGALLTAVQAVRPFMSAGGRVTATGSMAADQPSSAASSLGVQKAGLRNLMLSLDDALRDDGIRAVSVTVRGALGKEGPFTPDRVAEAIWAAARQSEADWRAEIPYSG